MWLNNLPPFVTLLGLRTQYTHNIPMVTGTSLYLHPVGYGLHNGMKRLISGIMHLLLFQHNAHLISTLQ